jgi:hypothetical protein
VIATENGANMPTASRERNEALLNERYIHGRRPQLRVSFEAYCRTGARPLNYSRLPGSHILLDFPTPSQAKVAIRLIQYVLKSLDGKFLDESLNGDPV